MRRHENPPPLTPSSSIRLIRTPSASKLGALTGSQLGALQGTNDTSNQTTDPVVATTDKPKSTLTFQNATKLKLIAASQRRKLQDRRRKNAILRLAPTLETEEVKDEPSPSLAPLTTPKVVEKCSIGTFETKDNKWKAVIHGDLDKFMYPSLRLEALYDTPENTKSRVEHAPNKTLESQPPPPKIPTAEEVDAAMAATTKVRWEVEKRFQNATQSAPSNGHPRVDDDELKRLHFDHQLETAEGLLRKKDLQLLDAKRQQGFLASISTKYRPDEHTHQFEGEIELASRIRRDRGASLYEPHIINTPQLIPRLPHTRKIMKEIQRHTTSDGQIQYYADRHNLFTKWKKLQVSELHKIGNGEREEEVNDTRLDSDDDTEEDVHRSISKLSPRSLFFHECVKKHVLPEPIFSRIHEVPAPAKKLFPLPKKSSQQFSTVVAKLVQAVHEKHTKHEDLVPTQDGKYTVKKHHLALHLQHFGLGDEKMDALSASLQHFQSIHVLDLSNNRLTDTSIIRLLESLEIASASMRPSSSTGVSGGSSRRRGNDLRVLNLSQNEIGVDGCSQIARFLGICSQLTHLDLSHAKISVTEATAPLTSAIETHRSLQVVNFSYNSIDSSCGSLVGDMLTQPSCSVTELDISWNSISGEGAIAIGRSLRTNVMLRKLNLAMNRFSDQGAEQLAAALASNTTLVELDLSRNNLGGRSAVAFAFFLRKNRSLLHLRLEDNHIGATGAKALLHTVSLGSPCEFHVSAHDIESLNGEKDPIFDPLVPSMLSPFVLNVGESPYDFAVASELIDAALLHKTCTLSDITFTDDRAPRKPVITSLTVDIDRGALVEAGTGRIWRPPTDHGIFCASASFSPPPVRVTPHLNEASCLALIRIIKRGFSSRDMVSLLALALNDLYMTTDQADIFVEKLRPTIDVVEIVGRLWPCLVDGDEAFRFLQRHLTAVEQRRLIDSYGISTIQFTTENPTGRWTLNLGDRGQRKIAIWFAMLNAKETAITVELHPKRTDASQYGKANNWRNASYNRKALRLNYSFFDRLPCSGLLEFDYVSTVRHEDLNAPTEITDDQLDALLKEIGAEVHAIYIPLHKRKDLKYQLILFHLAIANKFVTSAQAHRVLQYFPKNYETCRLKIILAVHRMLIDMENLDEMLDRLVASDRRRVYTALGYLNVVSPLSVDMDFEVDFERDDEKMLLRALVDLSMSCPLDMIRIESERSTVLVIYSMYQTNSVPSQGRMCFRYVSHPLPSRADFLRARASIARHFLCGERVKAAIDAALASGSGPLMAQTPPPSAAPQRLARLASTGAAPAARPPSSSGSSS